MDIYQRLAAAVQDLGRRGLLAPADQAAFDKLHNPQPDPEFRGAVPDGVSRAIIDLADAFRVAGQAAIDNLWDLFAIQGGMSGTPTLHTELLWLARKNPRDLYNWHYRYFKHSLYTEREIDAAVGLLVQNGYLERVDGVPDFVFLTEKGLQARDRIAHKIGINAETGRAEHIV